MRRFWKTLLPVMALALAVLACNLPTMVPATGGQPATPGVNTTPGVFETLMAGGGQATPGAPTGAASTPGAGATPGGQGSRCTYRASFIRDVTIPDNTVVPAGQQFVKTWRVRNDGSCAWGTGGHNLHALAFTSGEQMDAPAEVPLTSEVRPGETVDISVTMRAPATPGTYTGNWLLRVDGDPSGVNWVGLGPDGDDPLYVVIRVTGETQ